MDSKVKLYLERSDLIPLNSFRVYAAVNNFSPSNSAFIIINLTGFSLKNENNMFVSATNNIYHPSSLCLCQIRSFNSLPSLMQSSSVNLEFFNESSNFLSINNLLTLSAKNSLTNADQFVSGNCSISCFNSSGIDNVKLGILNASDTHYLLYSVYPVLYKSFGSGNAEEDGSADSSPVSPADLSFSLQKITDVYAGIGEGKQTYYGLA